MTDALRATDSTRPSVENTDSRTLSQSLTKSDWEKATPFLMGATDKSASSNTVPSQLEFDNIFKNTSTVSDQGPLTGITTQLQHDVQSFAGLQKGSKDYAAAQSQLDRDEATLKQDVFDFKKGSSDFQSFSSVMESYHSELKSVATDLWHMGLKDEARHTTAYYPLSHYEHEFKNRDHGGTGGGGTGGSGGGDGGGGSGGSGGGDGGGSGGGDGGSGTIPGAQVFNNLQAEKWKSNTNASQIGGSGDVQGMQITSGDTMDYSSQMGAYGDTLGSVSKKVAPDAKTYQLSFEFNPSANTIKNTQCLENDMVITTNDGKQAVAGSQFNLQEKAPDGMCWFQTWDTEKGKWMNAALVPRPQPGQFNDVSMRVHINDDGTYTYSPLVYNGKTYDLQNNTFNMKSSNWTRNQVVVQIQEDAGSHGGPVDEQYRNMTLQAK